MNVNPNNYSHLVKFLLVGDAATGKTCLMRKFIDGKFKPDSQHTVGVEFGSKIVQIDGKTVKLQIWDTAGQERFQSVTRSYYRGATGALVVYDVSERGSFGAVQKWLSAVRDQALSDVAVVLVGNKIDLGEDARQVTESEGRKWADEHNVVFLETSAKTGANVEEAFLSAVRGCLSRISSRQGVLYSANSISAPQAQLQQTFSVSRVAKCCNT